MSHQRACCELRTDSFGRDFAIKKYKTWLKCMLFSPGNIFDGLSENRPVHRGGSQSCRSLFTTILSPTHFHTQIQYYSAVFTRHWFTYMCRKNSNKHLCANEYPFPIFTTKISDFLMIFSKISVSIKLIRKSVHIYADIQLT